jgi:hypothetical protein
MFTDSRAFLKLLSVVFMMVLTACNNSTVITPTDPGSNDPKTANDAVKPYTANYQFGVNQGYYGNGWDDKGIYKLGADAGAHSARPLLDDNFLGYYGSDIRKTEFNYMYNDLSYRENVVFLQNPRRPATDQWGKNHEDWCDPSTYVTYSSGVKTCTLWAGMYEPIFVKDAGGIEIINPLNKMALYLEEVVKNYGQFIRFYEIINEPDIVGNYLTADKWCTQAPTKEDLGINVRADIFHYIRALRIAYTVIHKLQPEAYVAPGGIGYSCFLDALLRYTDNPDAGKVTLEFPLAGGAYFDVVSYHSYPQFGGKVWNNAKNGFDYFRYSDYMLEVLHKTQQGHEAVLKKYGYDASKFPTKPFIVTELNIPRIAAGTAVGGDEVQRNFAIKAIVKTQAWGIKQMYFYSLGESKNANQITDEIQALNDYSGFFENLTRDTPGAQKITQEGIANRTTSSQLLGWQYDDAATKNLNLPSSVDGAVFGKAGAVKYVLWAKTTSDQSETANASLNLPGNYDLVTWDGTQSVVNGSGLALTGTPVFLQQRP